MRISLPIRISLMFMMVGAVLIALGFVIGYSWGYALLKDTIDYEQDEIAQRLATIVSVMVKDRVEQIRVYISNPVHIDTIKSSAAIYGSMSKEAREEYLFAMDGRWGKPDEGTAFVNSILNNASSLILRTITRLKPEMPEIFTTDRYGGLTAASGMTSDFYQADEEWWQRAYNDGSGGVFIDEIQFDDSSKVWAVPISMSIHDESGEAIGACKAVFSAASLFGPLSNVSMGRTGRAMLFDDKGHRIYPPTRGKEDDRSERRLLSSAVQVDLPYPISEGGSWIVVVERAESEVYGPLAAYMKQGLALAGIIFLILLPISFLFGKIIARPIVAFKKAVDSTDVADPNAAIDIQTGDEVEDLADSFNNLIIRLSATLVSRDKLQEEVSERRKTEDRLALALKNSEKHREIVVSMLDDNNTTREALEESLKKLKIAQAQLIQAAKMEAVGMMASGVAHEVKNPLSIILQGVNYLEMVLPPEDSQKRETLQMMKDGIERANRIIISILDFARARELKKIPEDINSVIKDTINLMRHNFMSKNIEVVEELETEMPPVQLDKARIEQVFINFFSNAIYAMAKGGRLYVRSRLSELSGPAERAMVIEIEDTGTGMDEETKERLFEPFFTTKGRAEGTGLGLAVSKSIVEMHGGSLKIESVKGKGTKVIVMLNLFGDPQNG